MPCPTTPSFVCEFEVKATSKDLRILHSRLEAGRQLDNAIKGEALRRLARMRKDPAFDQAKTLPKGPLRKAGFADLRKHHRFTEAALQQHPSLAKDCWLRAHLDVHTQQKVASRAFKAVERWSFGGSGRPRFKRYGELESLEGKSNAAGIRYREGRVLWSGAFGNLELPLIVKDPDPVQAHALEVARTIFLRTNQKGEEVRETGVKYCRLLLRTIRGRERAFVQLVLRGEAFRKQDAKGNPKHPVSTKQGGMDIGPSHVAVVTEGQVKSFDFCAGLDRKEAARRVYLRKQDRQRRANNPENYREDGTVKPRAQRKDWQASRRQKATRASLQDLLRALAAHRKSLQGALAHAVLGMASELVTEKVSKRAWAKLWGRSVGHKAPGAFEARVGALAEASGGNLERVSTYRTFLSSRCLCGLRKKKALKERKHVCGCSWIPEGTHVDRHEFSAFLAMFAQGSALDEGRAREAWSQWGADSLLRSPSSESERVLGKALPSRRERGTRKNPSTDKGSGQRREVGPIRGRRAPRGINPSKTPQPTTTTKKGDAHAA